MPFAITVLYKGLSHHVEVPATNPKISQLADAIAVATHTPGFKHKITGAKLKGAVVLASCLHETAEQKGASRNSRS